MSTKKDPLIINNTFDFGEIVFLKTDTEQKPRIITAIEIFKEGEYLYKCSSGSASSYHYDYELSTERDILLTSTN